MKNLIILVVLVKCGAATELEKLVNFNKELQQQVPQQLEVPVERVELGLK